MMNTRTAAQNASQPQYTNTPALENKDNSIPTIPRDTVGGGIFILPNGGYMSAFAFKPDNFSTDNPVMLVKGTDASGKQFEVEININSVNPRNASIVELTALDGYSNAIGQPMRLMRQMMSATIQQNASGGTDVFAKFDFLAALDELMDAMRFHGNLNGYLQSKDLMEFLSGLHGGIH